MDANILFLFRGPQSDINQELGARLRLLSTRFAGLAIVPGYDECELEIGKFEIWSPEFNARKSLFFELAYVRKIRKRVRDWEARHKTRIDLVVTSDAVRVGLRGIIVAKLIGARTVIEVNGDHANPANYLDIGSPLKRLLSRWLYVSFEKLVLSLADSIKLLYPAQLKPLGINASKIPVASFSNFVDVSAFRNIEERKTILLAGFPFYIKGVDILIEAFKMVSPDHPDWSLEIIGYYPDDSLLKKAMGGHSNIRHLKPIPHSDMPEVIGKCGIFASASRTEAMGRVLLEAMKSGKPRVAADVGGCHTVVEDGTDGFLFPSEDTERLAQLLERLMSDSDLRARLGAAGAKRAAQEFTPEVYGDKTQEFYIRVLRTYCSGAGTKHEAHR